MTTTATTTAPTTAPAGPGFPPGLAMAAVVLFWGLGPPVSKLISAPALVAATFRFWLSVPLLLTLSLLSGHRPGLATLRRSALAGAAFGINMVFVFLSLQASAVAVLSILNTLQPGFVLLVAGPFLGERPGLWHVGWTAVGIGGSALVILGAGDGVETSWEGVAYAACALVAFTLYFLLTKRARSGDGPDIHPMEWMTGTSFVAALTVTPIAVLQSSRADFAQIGGLDWLWLAIVVVFTGSAGHVLMAWCHRWIDATRSSLYLLGLNLVAMIAAWPIHDEPITWIQAGGGLVVFGAVAAVITRPGSPRPLAAAVPRP